MSSESASFVVHAPAKVNLTLEILDERLDGYHDIRSVMLPVSLYDTVTVSGSVGSDLIECRTAAEGVELGCLAHLPTERHLAVRAALALREASGVVRGARISIVKRIPIGAGMGGGSADAAGSLVALNRLWGLDWPLERLAEVGARVGCDVPAMTLGGAVAVEGIGERVERIASSPESPAAPFWLVVVFPGRGVSTCEIYGKCGSRLTGHPETFNNVRSFVRQGNVHEASRWLFNGLQETVFRLHPEAKRCCQALRVAGLLSSLVTGSGSAVYGLAESRAHAESVRSRLGTGEWSRVLQTLPDGVMVAHGPLVP